MTATLDTAGRLSQQAALGEDSLVGGDGLASGLSPAERFRSFEPRSTRTFGVLRQREVRPPQRFVVAVRHELSCAAHYLRHARVPKSNDRAAARHGLQARKSKTLIEAGKQEAARGGVQVGQLGVVALAEHVRAEHAARSLAAVIPYDHVLELWVCLGGGTSGAQECGRVLSCVEGANAQQVAWF